MAARISDAVVVLSKADYDYYIDVTTRVTKKLAEVA